MVQRLGGSRRKTRSKLKKNARQKGKISIRRMLQVLKPGDRVSLSAEPGVQKGMHPPRFNGLTGTIKEKKGACYVVSVKDGSKMKEFIVHPIHLAR